MPIRFDIDIEVFAGPDAAPDATALQAAVEAGLRECWPAFGLPAEPAVQVRALPEAADLFEFTLRFNGEWVPVPVAQPGLPAPPLAFRILHAIFTHRTRLITDEQLRLLRAQLTETDRPARSWTSAPLPVWRAAATLLLEHGYSLDRLDDCFEYWSPDRSPEEAFERLIERPEVLTMTLSVSPQLAAANPGAAVSDWGALATGFYTEAFLNWGILLPQLQVETDKELSGGQFRLRLNDLWAPVLAGPEPGEVLYDRPGPDASVFVPTPGRYFAKTPGPEQPDPAVDGPWTYVFDWIRFWSGQCPGWYVNTGIIDALLDNMEENNRALIVMIREQWPTHRLCALLRSLLREGVSIRNLAEILDVLLRVDGPLAVDDTQHLLFFSPVSRVVTVPPGAALRAPGIAQLAGQVRAGLKYPVSFPYMRGGVLPAYNLDPALLRDLREGFFEHAIPEPGTAFARLLKSIRTYTAAELPRPVLIVPTGIRAAIVTTLRPYFPQMAILGNDELPPFFIPQIQAIINLT